MALTTDTCAAVLLAGGQSSRMGTCKALLTLQGETMVSRLCRQLESFQERILSANDPALSQGLPLKVVADVYRDCGPLGGLHAVLSATDREAVFCVPCDLPNFTADLPRLMLAAFPAGADAMICRDSQGDFHPLCGIYTRRLLPLVQAQLDAGERRMMALLRQVNCVYFDTTDKLPDDVFFNMNTQADLRRFQAQVLPETAKKEA